MKSKTLVLGSLAVILLMLLALDRLRRSSETTWDAETLVVVSAAGLKAPVDAAITAYEQHVAATRGTPVTIDIQYAGSGTLLSLLRVSDRGDLFVAADDAYIFHAQELGLVRETLPIARMTPVIALSAAWRDRIDSLDDLMRSEARIGIGMPDGTAIGAATRKAFESRGDWEALRQRIAVTKPTVNDLAADLTIGSLDAAIIFDTVARQHQLPFVHDPALDAETAHVMAGVLETTRQPAQTLHFARFLTAADKGLAHFADHHFAVIDGDQWAETPEIMLFSGGINKRAMDRVIGEFERREGVRVNTVFQGCGGLTAQMRAMDGQSPEHGFPDGYLACDVYYLDPVTDWFTDQAAVSSTRMVIVTAKDNPHNIQSLADLGKPGVRIVLGHPTHCTIGALSDRLLKAVGLYAQIAPNIVERQPSSGMMVPPVLSGAADASIAYYTDTIPERDRLTTIELVDDHGDLARAAQPFGVSAGSPHRHLMQRFYAHMGRHRDVFESLGFNWEYGRDPSEFNVMAPAGARPHADRGNAAP